MRDDGQRGTDGGGERSTEGPFSAPGAGSERLDHVFAALAHPVRRAMLIRLRGGAASAGELGSGLPISQPAVSKHLKVLERAGLISRGRDAQWRPCELRTDPLEAADAWLEGFRAAWAGRLDRLDRYIGGAGSVLAGHDQIADRDEKSKEQRHG